MKKLILLSLSLFILTNSQGFARTQGSYLGVDGVFTYGLFNDRFSANGVPTQNDSPHFRGKSKSPGFGVNYKYAINFGGPYIAPTIFYERPNTVLNGDNEDENTVADQNVRLEIKNRFGAKIDVGYDITDNIAIYALGGYAGVHYTSTKYSFLGTSIVRNRSTTDIVESFFYGGGMKVDFNQDFSMNLEYNNQQFDANYRTPNNFKNTNGTYNTIIHVAKLGFAFRF